MLSTVLYVAHSKDFDIDAPDTCYALGCTNDIKTHLTTAPYTTVLKYPCTYVCWYEITGFPVHYLRALIASVVNARTPELVCSSIVDLRAIINDALTKYKIVFKMFDAPDENKKIIEPLVTYTSAELNMADTIAVILDRIARDISLTRDHRLFLRKLQWVYDFSPNHQAKVCVMCACIAHRKINVRDTQYGISLMMDAKCVKKLPYRNYARTAVEDKIHSMGMDTNLILVAGPTIATIVEDRAQYLFSYIFQDHDDTLEVSHINITKDFLDKLFANGSSYCPTDAIGVIVAYMFQKNSVYIKVTEAGRELAWWNANKEKCWDVNVVMRYLDAHPHDYLAVDPTNSSQFIFTAMHEREKSFAELWRAIDVADECEFDVNKATTAFQQYLVGQSAMKDNYFKKQCRVFDTFKARQLTVLSGVAGSGKSTLAAMLCHQASSQYNVIQLTPTGKAAAVVKDKNRELNYNNPKVATIHSFMCNLTVNRLFMKDPDDRRALFHIDETSMVDLVLFVNLLKIIKGANAKVLISGDHDQLPPVGFGRPFQEMVRVSTSIVKLTKNKRIDSAIGRSMINIFRTGRCTSIGGYLDYGASKVAAGKSPKVAMYSTLGKSIMPYDEAEVLRLSDLQYQFVTYNNDICDKINMLIKYRSGQSKNLYIEDIIEGDKVMILKNGYDRAGNMIYYNGQEGIIRDIVRSSAVTKRGAPITKFNLLSMDCGQPITTSIEFTGTHRGRYQRSLLCYAWCKTIHKTQGDGFDNVCLVLDGQSIDKRSLNTAITRVKKQMSVLYSDAWRDRYLLDEPPYTSGLAQLFGVNESLVTQVHTSDDDPIEEDTNTRRKELLKGLLGRYNYNIKYQVDNDIPLSSRDIAFMRTSKYWPEHRKTAFLKLYQI
jgi:hypothetical protein